MNSETLSGWELDTLVAERVMGWQWMKRVGQNRAWLFPPDSVDGDTGEEGIFGEPIVVRDHIVGPFEPYDSQARKESGSDVPRYSSSVEAAMEVIEKMRDRLDWRLDTANGQRCIGWQVVVLLGSYIVATARSKSLPEAICHAALKAVDSSNSLKG